MKHLFLLIAVCAIVIISGCSNSSTGDKLVPAVVIPNVGTSWTLANTFLDSTGVPIKKTDTTIRTVVQTNMQYNGFSDVVMTVEPNPSDLTKSDTVYLRFLSNGDISRLSSPSIDPQLYEWLTVPYSTQSTQNFNFGGKINYLGYSHDTVNFMATYGGKGSATIGGISYGTVYSTTITSQEATGTGKDSTNYTVQSNTFIPSIGIFGGRAVILNKVDGKTVKALHQTLVSINLK